MAAAPPLHKTVFALWLIVFMLAAGCAGRRISTAVEDQAFTPGPSPALPTEAATVVPPAAASPEAPKVGEPAGETALSKARAEEVRVAEQPVVPTPPRMAASVPVQPFGELSDIFFDFDQSAIRGDARSALEADAAIFKSQANRKTLIEGHCDERGTSAYNLVLGERRAQAAKRYLEDLGVAVSQIQITSYGKERPFCNEHSEACWQSNRRAHFRHP